MGRAPAWGVFDTDLFDATLTLIDQRPAGRPFHVSVMTMDTHGPSYVRPPECPAFSPNDDLLNAIHCTDQAFGRLINGLRQRDLYDSTHIIVVGDHRPHGLGEPYGPVYFALRSPGRDLPSRLSEPGHTPDLAPTALEMLGLDQRQLYAGKSLLSERARFPHLVGPAVEVFDGELRHGGDCDADALRATRLDAGTGRLTDCERRKALAFQALWLRGRESL